MAEGVDAAQHRRLWIGFSIPCAGFNFSPIVTYNVTYNESYNMAEERMTLKAAAGLLGIHPNSVRSRYKKGKLRGEADNTGKIWVWVDPSKVANDVGSLKPTMKVTKEVRSNSEIKALQDHLKATSEQLEKAQAEIADLKPQAMEAVRLKAEVDGLREQQGRGEAEIARLVASMDKMDEERRELVEAVLRRRVGLWERIFGRSKD